MPSSGNIIENRYAQDNDELEPDEFSAVDTTDNGELFGGESSRHIRRNAQELSAVLQNLMFYDTDDEGKNDIQLIIEYIIGPESHWCSDSAEVKEFRKAIAASFECGWSDFHKKNPLVSISRAMRLLPQRFLIPPLHKTQLEMLTRLSPKRMGGSFGIVLLRIWYVDLAGCTCSSLREFPFNVTASDAIATTMDRLFSVTNIDKSRNKGFVHIFRIQGRNEYVYGNEKLINFRYIRDCVTQQEEVNVVVEPHDEALFTDPLFLPSYPSVVKPNKNHSELAGKNHSPLDPPLEISVWDIDDKISVKIVDSLCSFVFSPERAKDEGVREGDSLYVATLLEVYYGASLCCPPKMTRWVPCNAVVGSKELSSSCSVDWGGSCEVIFDMLLSDAPCETKLCVTLVATCGERFGSASSLDVEEIVHMAEERGTVKKSEELHLNPLFFLGSASVQFFNNLAHMRMGRLELRLKRRRKMADHLSFNPMIPDENEPIISLVFPTFAKPVVIPNGQPPTRKRHIWEQRQDENDRSCLVGRLRDSKVEQLRQLKRILASDPLTTLTPSDKVLLWKYREDLITRPRALSKFLLAVDWFNPYAAYEARSLLMQWTPLRPMDALELLDARYVDGVVREHAVKFLDGMNAYELKGCVLQLIQVLKHEPYYYSALSRFLLQRSLRSPHMIGHFVFWYLLSEMSNRDICERHGLLLEELIRRMPQRIDYLRQVYVADQLFESAMRVKIAPKKDRVDCLREHLGGLRLPPRFILALNPVMECSGVDIGKCKVMDSKKSPLWLVFHNYRKEGAPFFVIFKAGDDLRQDLLTLQLLELMDSLWKSCGLYLHVIPYGCVATGEGVGMIEVVPNGETIANITRKDGGAQAAFAEEPLMNWLRQFNRGRHEVERCVWNFVYSVAGYTVATYILGIGDRHNDNIMLRQDGTLFHIDFGHFLGNFKTKFGIKRETAPFIFTPMYAYVLGGQSSPIYLYFVDVACQAFNVIRRFSSTLMTLFLLMLSTGIPELQNVDDIKWLRTVLLIGRSNEEAKEHYKLQISLALSNIRTLLNDYIHIMAH